MDQLALALGVEADEEEEEAEDEDEPLDVLLLAAAFPFPDDVLSLELLVSELSDLVAGVLALPLLSSELLAEAEPGLP